MHPRRGRGNGGISVFTYDSANRTTDILHKQAGGTTLAHYQYAYDAASNVTSRTDTDGTVTTFGYDNSDQLTSEVRDNSHSTGYSISYTYDHNQNRLTKVLNGTTDTYTYDSHDKLLTAGSKSYTYDSNGNCTKVTLGTSVTTLTYDDSNRVTGISYPGGGTNSFVYNGEDLRVSKTDSAGTSAVTTDGATPASPVLKDSRAVYTPGLSEHAGSTSKFYHADALGSTRGITDATQATTDAVLYDAFGMTVSRTGTTATPFGFVGAQQYQTDADSGLQLLGHRYYDASVGRFISSDPIQYGDNWYCYVDNNPIDASDADGLQAEHRKNKSRFHHDKHTKRRPGDPEKGDIDRRDPPKKAGGGASPSGDRSVPQEPRDRGRKKPGDTGYVPPDESSRFHDPYEHYFPPTEAYYPPPPHAGEIIGGALLGGAAIIGIVFAPEVVGPLIIYRLATQ